MNMEITRDSFLVETCLSKRVVTACSRENIVKVGQLMDTNPFELARFYGMGVDSLREVEMFIKSMKHDERMKEVEGGLFSVKNEVFIPCTSMYSVPCPEEHSINLRYIKTIKRTSEGKAIIQIDFAKDSYEEYKCRIDYDELLQKLKEL